MAQIFGLICTVAETEEIEIDGKIEFRAIGRYLPQGSPASPAVSNLVCYHLDRHLARMAKNLGFCYPRYADDLTFSGSGDALRRISNLIDDSNLIITSEGFTVNPSKTKILSKAVQQEVTGIVVNKQLNISKKILKAFRATLYQIEQEGLLNKKLGNSKNLIAAITGFANYVAMVNSSKGAEFLASVKQIKQKYDNKSNIKYKK